LIHQHTIKAPATVSGAGLFSGEPCRMRFLPAPADSGIVFVRNGESMSPSRLAALIQHVTKRARRTSLTNGTFQVETVEHVLAAISGMGVDNLIIEINADETPSTDGSPLPFVEAIRQAEVQAQEAERKPFVIDQAITVSGEGGSMLAALPGPDDCLDIVYDLDYSEAPCIGRQVHGFRLGKDDFVSQIAPARTFLLEAEAREFQARGMGKHLTAKDLVVMGETGPIDNELRFANEAVRHKICDLVGDLMLLGRPLRGRVVAYKSGHELNHKLVRRLAECIQRKSKRAAMAGEPAMDIRRIMRLLPHRYPFLMVDRVISLEGDRKAIAVKNVSINEPYFQGHYPGQPIMPGVMILEALAQLSGILLSRRLEHTGKVAVLLSLDKAKMRRPVRPGDQLILEAEALHVRARTGHCRCRALLGDDVAAEAEIKFMLVDAEPI